MLEHLEKLVSFYPVSSDQQAVKRLLLYVKAFLKSRGMQVHILTYNGVHNLYASTRGQKHSKVLLQAHADVVPASGQPFRRTPDKAYGRGTYDVLFATAAFMQLVDDLGDQLAEYDLAIMLSGDEERGGFHGAKRFLEAGYTTDICILPDAGEGFGSMSIAAKGVYQPTIAIEGQAHHASRPWEGDNAARKLVHFLHEFESHFDSSDRHNSTMTIATIQAGEAANQGPAKARVQLDIRYKDQTDLARIKKVLRLLIDRFDGRIVSEVGGSDYQLAMSNADVKKFVALYKRHNQGPIRLTKAHGSSDARFFSEREMPVIMFRPDGGSAHGDQEWLSLVSLEKFYQLLLAYVRL